MGVFLGSAGCVELGRTSIDDAFETELVPSDINVSKRRFSFEFPHGQYLTGDLLEFATVDNSSIPFIPGYTDDQVAFFVHVDEADGITLHRSFSDALSGEESTRVLLKQPAATVRIRIMVENNRFNILGQVTSFEVNTEREAVDVTELGDSFRERYSSLITGNGQVTCLFEYEQRPCDEFWNDPSHIFEMPVYLNQLILRSAIGSEFFAKFILAGRGNKPGGNATDINDRVWYEFKALVTNVGMAFNPGEPVRVTMNYITTGPIQLHTQMTTDYITQEQDGTSRIEFEEFSEDGFLLHAE
jgi:hypothetical protein